MGWPLQDNENYIGFGGAWNFWRKRQICATFFFIYVL